MFRFLIALAQLSLTAGVYAADLETILDKNAKAHGGDALSQVQAVKVSLDIVEPTFEVSGTYVATRDGLMRIDIYAGEDRVFAEGLVGDCAWEWNPGQAEADVGACVGEAETAALRNGIELPGHFYTLKDVRARGAAVNLIGSVESDAGPQWQLRVMLEDGTSRDYFIDQKTHRIMRARDHRAFHPGVDPTKVNIETRFEEPEFQDGVLRFRRQVNVNVDTGEVLGTTTVRLYEHNPEVSEGMFEAGWVPR